MRRIIPIFTCFIFLISCSADSERSGGRKSKSEEPSKYNRSAPGYAGDMATEAGYEMKEGEKNTNISDPIPLDQKLIKTGNIGFETEDIKLTRGNINQLIKEQHGYISNETEDYYSQRINQRMTIKIPNASFERFVEGVCNGVTKFDTKNITVYDVTEEFVDTETRINNKKALEQKYILLLNKAVTIEDILEIENQVNYLREDIEVAEAKLKKLSQQVSYSTLELYIYQKDKVEAAPEKPEENRFVKGLKAGWQAVVNFLVGLTYAWPAILIMTIGFFVGKKYIKKWIK